MKSQIRVAAFLLLAVLFTLFMVEAARAQTPNMVLETAGDNLSRIELTIRGKDPVRYTFKAEKGAIAGGIALPKSGSADYEITAYDLKGNLTHIGTGTLGSAGATDKGTLLPLDSIDGGVGLVATVNRERIVLEVGKDGSPDRMSVRASVLDAQGKVAAYIKPGDIIWTTSTGKQIQLIPRDNFSVDVVPNKDSTIYQLCPLGPVVGACLPGRCKPVKLCTDPFVQVSAGDSHTCALTREGNAFCWGINQLGQLGAPTTTSCTGFAIACSPRPTPVVCPAGAPCKFTQISAGHDITVAVDTNGDAWWWGRGFPQHHLVSAVLAGAVQKFSLVTAGFAHACALSQRSEVWCWGANFFGETGAPASSPVEVPDTAPVRVLVPLKFKRVSAGRGEKTCAVGNTGTDVVCWGRNDFKQSSGTSFTGFPNATTGPFFFQQFGGLVTILDVATSPGKNCATLSFGVRCWGDMVNFANLNVFGVPDKFTVGELHACGLSAQLASCLGPNAFGQLGDGTNQSKTSPVPVLAPPPLYTDISAGAAHTCGVTPDGDVFCWGSNTAGQLGVGFNSSSANTVPRKVVSP